MGFKPFMTFIMLSSLSLFVQAQDVTVQTLSDGACWLEQGEILKLASFNDKESVSITRDEIEEQVSGLLGLKKHSKALTSDLTLHCGGYGSSLIIKTEMDGRPVCLWTKWNKGQLGIRSLGGLEDIKGDLCDGYKWGELIVGIKNADQKNDLQSVNFQSMIKSVVVVSGTTLKLTLQDSYVGKEKEVMQELKKLNLKYIELNSYQHPVGEFTSLK